MIIFYTTYCPQCKVLEKKLKEKNIPYQSRSNIDEMIIKGFTRVPVLEVDGTIYNFKEAIDWVNSQEAQT